MRKINLGPFKPIFQNLKFLISPLFLNSKIKNVFLSSKELKVKIIVSN